MTTPAEELTPRVPKADNIDYPSAADVSPELLAEQFPENQLEYIRERLKSPEFAFIGALEALGATVYLTGGTVRDSLVGKQPKDFDFVVSFDRNRFDSDSSNVIPGFTAALEPLGSLTPAKTGSGVYKFRPQDSNETFDIAFPRNEFAPDQSEGRARDLRIQSDPFMSFADDVRRRDFTVNGLALRINAQSGTTDLLDYVDGLQDLQAKKLRTIGPAAVRIEESPNRIMRAIWLEQKGFELDTELEQAIKESVRNGVFNRRDANGKLILAKEKIAREFLKAFTLNPVNTLKRLDELGSLPFILPELITPVFDAAPQTRRLRRRDIPQARQDTRVTPFARMEMRCRYFDASSAALAYLVEKYPEAGPEEMLTLLSLNLGKVAELKKEETAAGALRHDRSHFELTRQRAERMIRNSRLEAAPADSPYHIDLNNVLANLDRYKSALGLLSPEAGQKNDGKYEAAILNTFPLLTRDPLLHILEASINSSPNANGAKGEFESLRSTMTTLEQKIAAVKPAFNDLITGGMLLKLGLPRSERIGQILYKLRISYNRRLLSGESMEPASVRSYLMTELTSLSEARAGWRQQITDEDRVALMGSSAALDKTQIDRLLLQVIEQRVAPQLTEQPGPESAATSERHQHFTSRRRRSKAKREAECSAGIPTFGDLFITRLTENPQAILAWLDDGFKKNKRGVNPSLVGLLFPELAAMVDCTQDHHHHSEGTAWEHTRLLFKQAVKLKIPLTKELAIAILYHDAGKPETRTELPDGGLHFHGHQVASARIFESDCKVLGFTAKSADLDTVSRLIRHHMVILHIPLVLESDQRISNLFPMRRRDPLIDLMRCDRAASRRPGHPDDELLCQEEMDFFTELDKRLEALEIQDNYIESMEVLWHDPIMVGYLTHGHEAATKKSLVTLYMAALHDGQLLSPAELIIRSFRDQPQWCLTFVKDHLLTGKAIHSLDPTMTGPAMGELQKFAANSLVGGKIAYLYMQPFELMAVYAEAERNMAAA